MAGISTVADRFSASSLDASIWAPGVLENGGNLSTNVTLDQSTGVLVVTPVGGATTEYNGYISLSSYDLTNDAIFVNNLDFPDAATCEAMMVTGTYASDYLHFIGTNATLLWQYNVNGVGRTTVGSTAKDLTTHAWWRIRHGTGGGGGGSGDNVYWDTAPDSSGTPGTWIQRGTAARPIVITAFFVSLMAGSWGSAVTPGTFKVDNLNLASTPQLVVPASLVVNPGSWTDNSGGTTDLITPVTTTGTSDYDQTPLKPSGTSITWKLGALAQPDHGTRILMVAVSKDVNDGVIDATVNVRVHQAGGGGTLIQSFNKDGSGGATSVAALGNIGTTDTPVSLTITGTITDWSNIDVEVLGTQSG